MKNNVGLRGFGKVQLVNHKTGEVEFETGFENTFITKFKDSVLQAIGDGTSNAKSPQTIALGSGGSPASNASVLPNQYTQFAATGSTQVSASTRLRVTGSFNSTQNTGNISSMGLHDSATNDLICGETFTDTFSKSTSQDLNVTYDITWSYA